MTSALTRPSKNKLTTVQMKQLANLTDTSAILATLQKLDWTIEESIKYIVEIARDAKKEATRLNAIRYLNQLVSDTMEHSGLTVMATHKVIGEDGEEMSLTGHVVSSILRDQSEHTTEEELFHPELKELKESKEDADGSDQSDNGTDTIPVESQTEDGPTERTTGREPKQEETPPVSRSTDSTDLGSCKPPEGRGVLTGNFPGISNFNRVQSTGNLRDYFPVPESDNEPEPEDPDA